MNLATIASKLSRNDIDTLRASRSEIVIIACNAYGDYTVDALDDEADAIVDSESWWPAGYSRDYFSRSDLLDEVDALSDLSNQ